MAPGERLRKGTSMVTTPITDTHARLHEVAAALEPASGPGEPVDIQTGPILCADYKAAKMLAGSLRRSRSNAGAQPFYAVALSSWAVNGEPSFMRHLPPEAEQRVNAVQA